jgi:hypothetical protein
VILASGPLSTESTFTPPATRRPAAGDSTARALPVPLELIDDRRCDVVLELAVHDGLFEREHGSNSSRGSAWPGPATRRCRPSSAAHAPCRQALCSPKRPKGDRQQSASRSRRANGLRERRSSRAGAGPGTTPTTPHRLTRRSGAVRLRGVRAVAGPRRTPRRPPRQRSIADGGFLKP